MIRFWVINENTIHNNKPKIDNKLRINDIIESLELNIKKLGKNYSIDS